MVRRTVCFVVSMIVAVEALGSADSIGPNGIRSNGLYDFDGNLLNGTGIDIGQVESLRPGRVGYDTATNCCEPTTVPTQVYYRDAVAMPNQGLSAEHAIWVAGLMKSTDAVARGVSTGMNLHSAAFDSLVQSDAAITSQYLADTVGVSAINMSFGLPLVNQEVLNGDSLLTAFVDWSAKQHDVLYVVAGNEGVTNPRPVPTDEFNGITVAASRKNETDGVFREVSVINNFTEDQDAVGVRTSVDLLAPGVQLDLIGPNGQVPDPEDRTGTSYSAPHVTGTAALLNQYSAERIMDGGWSTNSQRHEVLKAVMMNSTDKIKDTGDGLLLGMDRTVLKAVSTDTWLDSDAFVDDEIPLDEQMGAGHLNARRALQQLRPGEFDAGGSPVPAIGWDYGATTEFGDIQTYALSQSLPENQYVSITLAWDRDVLLDLDFDGDGAYDVGDEFLDASIPTDLNLYLVPAGMGIAQAVAKSVAVDNSLEHIFAKIETPGMYEIMVEQVDSGIFGDQSYALAWWTRSSPASLGDYSGNGSVGPEDYTIWVNNFGTTNPAADGNGDGIVDAADYSVWRDHLGQVLPGSGSATAVPETSAAWLLASALACFWSRRGLRV